MNHKLVLFLLLLLITICFFGIASGDEFDSSSSSSLVAQVTTQRGPLNMRSLPQADATILHYIPNGSLVTVINQGDVFWEIQYETLQGYAMHEFLTLVDSDKDTTVAAQTDDNENLASSDKTDEASIAQVTTEVGPLNLRNQANAGATILARIPNRSLVTVLAQGEVFWEIAYGDYRGYAMREYLTMTEYTPDILNYRLLYRGNTGSDVVALKERLMELGYYRAGSNMNESYNQTCIDRVMMFQRQNGLNVDGMATAEVQAKLFAANAIVNTEELPKVKTNSFIVSSPVDPQNGIDENFDWDQWMLNNPGVCSCCFGSGCSCCNYTGQI